MQEFSFDIGSKKLTFKINNWAMQASSAVLAQYGETIVLATVMQSDQTRPGIDFLPLLVDYDERFYAGGKIGGSRFVRREGKPSDEAILSDRMIDRSLRPLFDSNERREVQIIITVLSFDRQNDPDLPSLLASSLALCLSPIPFEGPIGAVRLGFVDGKLIINPSYEEREKSDLDLVLAGRDNRITMMEVKAKALPEKVIEEALKEGLALIQKLVTFQHDMVKHFSPQKNPPIREEYNSLLTKTVQQFCKKQLRQALFKKDDITLKESIGKLSSKLLEEIVGTLGQEYVSRASSLFYEELGTLLKQEVLTNGIRPDGRRVDELRPIECQVGVFPRTHGSALFLRGMTHALSVVTLGAPGEELWIDTMETEEKRRFMHHYNFPPFCVGELRPLRAPSRRDLGHGYLAQRAIEPMLPSKEAFPYTIRVVSEILSSNGSSSMASVCGSSLALMDAGVPIREQVAGIAMGLLYESDEMFEVLTDIQGPEDHSGEMDCKIAGTKSGITAIQMDTKIKGVPLIVLTRALEQAKKARLEILEKMDATIKAPRDSISPYAPLVLQMKINPAKIRFVIGPGGEVINDIIAKTGTKIDIEDDGTIFITAPDKSSGMSAQEMIERITRELKEGDMVKGTISGITDFGAFVKIAPGKEGLIHISELADTYVKSVKDFVSLGDTVDARVIGIDREGKIRLSLKKAPRLAGFASGNA